MPTCSAFPLRSPSLKTYLRDARTITSRSKRACRLPGVQRASTALAPRQPPATDSLSPRTPLTTLHHTATFVRRVLPPRVSPDVTETQSLEFWEEMMSTAQIELSASKMARAARIVVYGTDQYSGANELVTALLEEPFAPHSAKARVRDRWKNADESAGLRVRYGSTTQDGEATLSVRFSWLQQFPIPVEIHELPPPSTTEGSPSHAKPLFSADIPVIVCNPFTTNLSELFADSSIPWTHSNAILVVTSSSAASSALLQRLQASAPKSLTVLFVDPERALSALSVLSTDPGSASSVQRYQDGFVESRVSEVSATISQNLAAFKDSTEGGILNALRTQNALDLVSDSLYACRRMVMAVEYETDRVRKGASSLRSQMEEFKAKIRSDVLGTEEKPEVKESLERARVGVKGTMDFLTGWRMLWKVDDIADTINASVDRSWCRGLEDKLIFQTGRLSVTQNFLAGAANALVLSFPKTSTFHSPVLQNTLAQLRSQPTYAVNPATLTQPIHARRIQLTYPTSTLHRSAQRTVLGMSGSVLGGISIAWAGWAEHLGILGSLGLGLEAETAAGLGMFSAVAGIWYSIGRWEKAKRRWWRDWDRVGEGLERDLRSTLDRVVANQVLVVPTTACSGLRDMIAKREDEVAQLKDEITTLEQYCTK